MVGPEPGGIVPYRRIDGSALRRTGCPLRAASPIRSAVQNAAARDRSLFVQIRVPVRRLCDVWDITVRGPDVAANRALAIEIAAGDR
ncbi:MAG: hypothetical protein ACRD0V_04530 [Acidimicrobiales bacterium]